MNEEKHLGILGWIALFGFCCVMLFGLVSATIWYPFGCMCDKWNARKK